VIKIKTSNAITCEEVAMQIGRCVTPDRNGEDVMKSVQAMLAEAEAEVPRISPDQAKGLLGIRPGQAGSCILRLGWTFGTGRQDA
jgi:hypothetical protein